MKKILIALNNKAGAQKVAGTGYELSKVFHINPILIHVKNDIFYYSSIKYLKKTSYDANKKIDVKKTNVVEKLKRTIKEYKDIKKMNITEKTIETVLKEGDYAENI